LYLLVPARFGVFCGIRGGVYNWGNGGRVWGGGGGRITVFLK